jgi:hypothetical protein
MRRKFGGASLPKYKIAKHLKEQAFKNAKVYTFGKASFPKCRIFAHLEKQIFQNVKLPHIWKSKSSKV